MSNTSHYHKKIINGEETFFPTKTRNGTFILVIPIVIFFYIIFDIELKNNSNDDYNIFFGLILKSIFLLLVSFIIVSIPFSDNTFISSSRVTHVQFFFNKVISKKEFQKSEFILTVLPG